MTEENLVSEQDPFSDVAAADNLAVYLHEIGATQADIQNTSKFNRRIIAEVPLTLQLEALHTLPEATRERNELVEYFVENNWLPKQLQEANIAAVKGVDETLRRAQHASRGNPAEAQAATQESLKRYFNDALHDIKTLNLVRTRREGNTMLPNIESLRVTKAALYTIADMFLAREFLDRAEWANSNWTHYTQRQRYWRGFMLFAAEFAGDEVLAQAFNHMYVKAQNRRRFWAEGFKKIDRKLGGLATQIPKSPEPSTRIVVKTEDNEPEKVEEMINWEELMPEGAKEDLERAIKEYANKDTQIDRYVNDQGMTVEDAENRVLGGRAIRHQGRVVGVEGKEPKAPSTAHISRSVDRSAPKRYRAIFSDTDDLAARQQRSVFEPSSDALDSDETSGPEETRS